MTQSQSDIHKQLDLRYSTFLRIMLCSIRIISVLIGLSFICVVSSKQFVSINNPVQKEIRTRRQIYNGSTDCQLPRQPDNGYYTVLTVVNPRRAQRKPPDSWVKALSVMVYSCNGTDQLDSPHKYITCIGGQWNYPIPKCVPTCSPRISSSVELYCERNGQPIDCSQRMLEGTTMDMKCKPFHTELKPFAHFQITCSGGLWDHDILRCEPDCGRLDDCSAALANNHPWNVGVYKQDHMQGKVIRICSGTIINPKVVVSAAHCFTHSVTGELFPHNDFTITAAKDYQHFDDERDMATMQKRKVEKIIVHEGYKGIALSYSHDIALVILEEPFELTTLVTSICVDNINDYQVVGDTIGKLAGWNVKAAEGKTPDPRLREQVAPIIHHDNCTYIVPSALKSFLTYDKFCAGFTNGSNVCQWDTGGGFITKENNGLYYLRGVASNVALEGQSCDTEQVAVYTNIAFYRGWLDQANAYYI